MRTPFHFTWETLLRAAASNRCTAKVSAALAPVLLRAASRPGALVLGVSSIESAREALRPIHRSEDVVAIEPGGLHVQPFLDFGRDSRAVANWIETREAIRTGDPLVGRLLLAACVVAKMAGLGRVESFDGIADATATLVELARSIGSRHKNSAWSDARASFVAAAEQGVIAPWEQATLDRFLCTGISHYSRLLEAVAGVHAVLSPWLEGPAVEFLGNRSRPEFRVEQLWDAGVIAVADRSLPASIAEILTDDFYRVLASRGRRVFFDGQEIRAVDGRRPAFLFTNLL
jgi:hypothetical protein